MEKTSSSGHDYFYRLGRHSIGPFGKRKILDKVIVGEINARTLIRSAEDPVFRPMGVSELAPLLLESGYYWQRQLSPRRILVSLCIWPALAFLLFYCNYLFDLTWSWSSLLPGLMLCSGGVIFWVYKLWRILLYHEGKNAALTRVAGLILPVVNCLWIWYGYYDLSRILKAHYRVLALRQYNMLKLLMFLSLISFYTVNIGLASYCFVPRFRSAQTELELFSVIFLCYLFIISSLSYVSIFAIRILRFRLHKLINSIISGHCTINYSEILSSANPPRKKTQQIIFSACTMIGLIFYLAFGFAALSELLLIQTARDKAQWRASGHPVTPEDMRELYPNYPNRHSNQFYELCRKTTRIIGTAGMPESINLHSTTFLDSVHPDGAYILEKKLLENQELRNEIADFASSPAPLFFYPRTERNELDYPEEFSIFQQWILLEQNLILQGLIEQRPDLVMQAFERITRYRTYLLQDRVLYHKILAIQLGVQENHMVQIALNNLEFTPEQLDSRRRSVEQFENRLKIAIGEGIEDWVFQHLQTSDGEDLFLRQHLSWAEIRERVLPNLHRFQNMLTIRMTLKRGADLFQFNKMDFYRFASEIATPVSVNELFSSSNSLRDPQWRDFAFLYFGSINVGILCTRQQKTMLAVRLYQQKYGTFPPTLSRLQPEFLDMIPLNPFSGKPLGYEYRERMPLRQGRMAPLVPAFGAPPRLETTNTPMQAPAIRCISPILFSQYSAIKNLWKPLLLPSEGGMQDMVGMTLLETPLPLH